MSASPERLARIEQLITGLVQTAPSADAALVDELVELLHGIGSPLARSIAQVLVLAVEQRSEQRIDPGIALPPLAMACATLAGGERGSLGERELEAARFEIETLLPIPSQAPAAAVLDVPVSALLSRGPRPRT